MALKKMQVVVLAVIILSVTLYSQGQNPCGGPAHRALVLSGGGVRGAFEAGAIWYLVVQRGCDFDEMSGLSVGGLNAGFLAQARSDSHPEVSLAEFTNQAEDLVELWTSIRSSRDVYKARHFAFPRLAFGLDSFYDFKKLERLVHDKISTTRLQSGRAVRVGVVSTGDGQYYEIVSNPGSTPSNFLVYVYAGAVLPIMGRQVTITDNGKTIRYWDPYTRHITPILSYFRLCLEPSKASSQTNEHFAECNDKRTPKHEPVEQLFVLLTSPYTSFEDTLPMTEEDRTAGTGKLGVPKLISRVFLLPG